METTPTECLQAVPKQRREQPQSVNPGLSTDKTLSADAREPASHVLLIEDDLSVAKSLKGLLELGNFWVDHAADGEAGLAMARTGAYAAIVLDRVLPKLSGDRILECLKREGNPTPVIILTGFPGADSAFEAGLLRAAGYLQKGRITGAELCAAVSSAVATAPPVGEHLFSAYSGHTSQCYTDLVATLNKKAGVDRSDLLHMLADTMVFSDLTFVEFVALAKAMRMLHVKLGIPVTVLLPRVLDWLGDAAHSEAARLPAEGDAGSTRDRRRVSVMRRAALELLTSDEYVSQIAYALGYSDAGNFVRDFRDFFGLPPSSFRRLA